MNRQTQHPEIAWQWQAFGDLSTQDLYALLALRQAVFVVEQDCAYQDVDGLDPGSMHLLGRRAGVLVAYLRALPPSLTGGPAAIGRVVTHGSARGQGLGRPLMREGMRRLWDTWGDQPIHISAQAHLAAYYGSLGFVQDGPGYLEDGIPHVPMTCPAQAG